MSDTAPFTLALAQLTIHGGNVDENVTRATDAIATAATRGANLVALPEVFNVGYFAFDLYSRLAEPLTGPTIQAIRDAAREHEVAVLAGSIVEDLEATADDLDVPVPATDGFANTAVLFDETGERRLVYRKHHLFGYGSAEQELLVPGERREVAEIGGFTVGVTTCYDLRFPELYRDLVDDGADLVLVPSAWPYPRVEHWNLFPQARAVENQCYVAAVNGTGEFDDATLLGRSSVYDPWGTKLAGSGDEATIVTAHIDPARVEAVRDEFPALEDRRRR